MLEHVQVPLSSVMDRYPPSGIDILVVGGGLGGMFAAIECYRKGHTVRVLESASEFGDNGTASVTS